MHSLNECSSFLSHGFTLGCDMQRFSQRRQFLIFSVLQFVHLRKPRETLSSRQTTLLTAACTQTAKGAPCPPLTAGPTPAPNRNRRRRPTGRSCAWSPAKIWVGPSFRDRLFPPTSPCSSYLSALSPAFLR